MLRSIKIQNLAILPSLAVDFHSGLNVLTGETGAGKSILVEAIGLLAGKRASSHDVRKGEDLAVVEGVIEFSSSAMALGWLKDQGISCETNEVILRRSVSADGRSRVWANGWQWNVSGLAEFAKHWVDVSGQHGQQALLDERTHLEIVDSFGDLGELAKKVRSEFRKMQEIERRITKLRTEREEFQKQKDFLLFQHSELKEANLILGEEEDLQNRHHRLAHASKLAEMAQEIVERVEADGGLLDHTGKLFTLLSAMAHTDSSLKDWQNEAEGFSSRLHDLLGVMRGYLEGLEAEPEEIEQINQRLAKLQQLARKYGSIEKALAERDRIGRAISSLEDFSFNEECLIQERDSQAKTLLGEAQTLSGERKKSADRFSKEVTQELKHLGMKNAKILLDFETLETEPGALNVGDAWISENGLERARLRFAPNPGEGFRPLAKIASGGELSRVLLAIKNLSAGEEGGKEITFLFDEVDTGIGGDTAERIGIRLKSLSQGKQVLCVTHLAQIACYASSHLVVKKVLLKGRTTAQVQSLSDVERKEELARMIGGIKVTQKTLEHAQELLLRGGLRDKGEHMRL